MRRLLLCSLMLAPAAAWPAAAQAPFVRVDPRIELTTIVFRLIGANEYSRCAVPAYAADIDRHFAPFQAHATLRLAERIRETNGIGFDAVPGLAVALTDPPALAARVALGIADNGLPDRRWIGPHAAEFAQALKQFARDAQFEVFFAAHRSLYDTTEARMRAFIAREVELPRIARFFGERPTARFFAVPGMCNGGANYGPRVTPTGGTEERFAILGMAAIDSAGLPVMDASDVPTIVHEFLHSYVNPVVARRRSTLRASGERLMQDTLIAHMMADQAYGQWETVINETLVRASVIRYLRHVKGDSAAEIEMRDQYASGFLWMRDVDSALAIYEQSRKRYPRFVDAAPLLRTVFTRAADSLPAMVRAFEAKRPRVRATLPVTAAAVPVTDTTITVQFDRPMARGYSTSRGPGGEATWPAARNPRWNSDRTAITFTVTLKPQSLFEVRLRGLGFRAADTGVPLRDFLLTFATP